MKKWNLILVFIISLLSLTTFAADPEPQPAQDQQQAEMTEEQKEALQEARQAQQEALEEAREAQEEAWEAQKEAMEAQEEAQKEIQEGLKEAQKGLMEAQQELKNSGINLSLPRILGSTFGMSASTAAAPDAESILLIPDKSLDPKILGQLTEDMQVMTMVLEEKIAPDKGASAGGYGKGSFGGSYTGWMTLKIFNTGPSGPKTVYLGGYGMIFTLDVDFPLVLMKGAEEKPVEAAQEKKDEVWQRSKDRLKGQDKPIEKEQDKEPSLVFDQEKVKQLQKDLTAALKHAANIRNLEPREKIVVVVRSVIDGDILSQTAAKTPEAQTEEPVSIPTSVMTLRADKQDIDAFAADEIDFDKFTEKASVVIY